MSNYKQLKSNPEYNISLVDIMSFVTKTNKAKYLDLFCKLYKNKFSGGKKNNINGEKLVTTFNIPQSEVDMLTSFSTFIHCLITENMSDEINAFQKFVKLNERGLIEKNDVLAYTSIDELKTEVSKSESRHIEKEMEKQVHKISDDEEWLMLRPLTYESSKKYGSNTKWCTTHNERSYFDKYTKGGILIYMINKKTGVKVAVFRSLKHSDNGSTKEFSFWDQKDINIDSLESGLPDYIKSNIMEEIKNNPYTNLEVYAKRNKIQVPKEEEMFKKRRSIISTEEFLNDVVPEALEDQHTFIERIERINTMTRRFEEGNRNLDVINQLVDNVLMNRIQMTNHLEEERIREANEDIENQFLSEMRELEDGQEQYVDDDFISEMQSREDDVEFENDPLPMGQEMVDYYGNPEQNPQIVLYRDDEQA